MTALREDIAHVTPLRENIGYVTALRENFAHVTPLRENYDHVTVPKEDIGYLTEQIENRPYEFENIQNFSPENVVAYRFFVQVGLSLPVHSLSWFWRWITIETTCLMVGENNEEF